MTHLEHATVGLDVSEKKSVEFTNCFLLKERCKGVSLMVHKLATGKFNSV